MYGTNSFLVYTYLNYFTANKRKNHLPPTQKVFPSILDDVTLMQSSKPHISQQTPLNKYQVFDELGKIKTKPILYFFLRRLEP